MEELDHLLQGRMHRTYHKRAEEQQEGILLPFPIYRENVIVALPLKLLSYYVKA